MLKKIVGVVVLAVLSLAGYAATRPDAIHVERQTTLAAPPDVTLSQISDFHQWAAWSPWEKLDPNMKKTYAGVGVGSSYAWAGNDQVGEGRMTLTGVDAQRVTIKLEFLKPFAATYTTTFVASSEGSGTRLTWNMDGRADYLTKLMGIFMPMDKMVGPDFERGLAQLKPLAEAEAKKRAASGG
jgi:hypothetical protein